MMNSINTQLKLEITATQHEYFLSKEVLIAFANPYLSKTYILYIYQKVIITTVLTQIDAGLKDFLNRFFLKP